MGRNVSPQYRSATKQETELPYTQQQITRKVSSSFLLSYLRSSRETLRKLWRNTQKKRPLRVSIYTSFTRNLYITLLLITISGVLKLLLSGEEVNLIISKVYIDYFNYELADQFQTVHVISAYFLVLLFTIHLGAVVYHHLIQKDPILKKML